MQGVFMCGIIGIIKQNTCDKEVVDLLKQLEYRGYDSSGFAYQKDGKIFAVKALGEIDELKKQVSGTTFTTAIAHTRWATHGNVSLQNTHPHLSQNNKWALVHNGIIENFTNIKKELISDGFAFNGETDSEVIVNLLQKYDEENKVKTLLSCTKKLIGSYAILCISNDRPDTLFLAKNKSPLYIGTNQNKVIVSSDIISFGKTIKNYYCLEDGEICEASTKKITFYNKNGNKIAKKCKKISHIEKNIDSNNQSHYMIKEINQTSNVLKRIITFYQQKKVFKFLTKDFIKKFNKIVLVGCGTAYHASLLGEHYFRKHACIDAKAFISSEFIYSSPIIDDYTLCVFISQSGETADTISACEMAKKCKATTIALTNVNHSTLSQMCDYALPVCAGTEISVASTKAYIAQVAILYMLSMYLRNLIFKKSTNFIKKLKKLSENTLFFSQNKINKIVTKICETNKVIFLGRNLDYVTALESSLKLKEVSYINSSAYPTGELKHGYLALVDNQTYALIFITQPHLINKSLNGANEVASRGGKVILITPYSITKQKINYYKRIKLPKFDNNLMPIQSIIFGQLLAYHTSVYKSINPDKPKNLAKSVTVE